MPILWGFKRKVWKLKIENTSNFVDLFTGEVQAYVPLGSKNLKLTPNNSRIQMLNSMQVRALIITAFKLRLGVDIDY